MQADVVIVGAGPTGLALACDLWRRGSRPLVLDRLAAGANTSRAAVIHARTLEVLEPLGVSGLLIENGLRVDTFRVRNRGKILATIRFDELPTKYPFTLMCPQDTTERILLGRLEALGGAVTRPCEVISVRDGVVRYRCGDREEEVTAGWIVGCDGSHSVVREQAGISFEGGSYEEAFILADVEMDWPLGREEVNLFFSEQGLVVVAPLPGGHFRIVATVDGDGASEPGIKEFQNILEGRGPEGDAARIRRLVWSSRFHISHRVANALREGNVLLAGDAAHVHSPAGGQGMNTGIQDAVSLAAALFDGSEGALAEWEKERLGVARSVVKFTDRMTRAATASSPLVKRLRDMAIEIVGHIPAARQALAENLAELERR